jgi:hypothetical protein
MAATHSKKAASQQLQTFGLDILAAGTFIQAKPAEDSQENLRSPVA